jgi:hypothetical protein
VDIRPRTLGENLDDAWRLAFADAPLLLLFNSLFLVPIFIVMLVLLAQPVPSGLVQGVLPALAALLLPLTGLASAACQELFRCRAEEEPVVVRDCLTAALRHGVEHAAGRAVLLGLVLPGPFLLMYSFLPGTSPIVRFLGFLGGSLLTFLLSLPLWGACTSLHALLNAGAVRTGTLLRELLRDVAAAPGKAAALVFSRLSLLVLLAIELHLLGKVVLWIADNLAGFDTTMLEVQLAFLENPVYTTALFLLSWLLLTPFFEAGNFLLHMDIRARQEGLDLQYRVQRAFGGAVPTQRWSRVGLVLMGVMFAAHPLHASEDMLETVRAARQDIETIRTEIEKAEPYPGGARWQGRLRALQAKLERAGGGDARRFRWFERAITDFGDRKKEDTLHILDDLHRRLSLLEEASMSSQQPAAQAREKRSPEDIKSLLRGSEGRKEERDSSRQRIEDDRRESHREEVRREEARGREQDAPHGGGGRAAPVSVPAASGGGLSFLGWLLLGGLALAVVVVGIFLYLTSPRSPRTPKLETVVGTEKLQTENDTRQVVEESPATLWRQAETLAGAGQFREAVRVLYLAVLALLHRQHLIRFEPMRTNGEYVQQVRLSEQAPPELHEPFEGLTQRFEMAWYGERPCESGDYSDCRNLANKVQQLVG